MTFNLFLSKVTSIHVKSPLCRTSEGMWPYGYRINFLYFTRTCNSVCC